MDAPKQHQTKKIASMGKKYRIAFPVRAWGMKKGFQLHVVIIVTILVNATIYLTKTGKNNLQYSSHNTVFTNSGDSPSQCDLFSGKWVFDNISYPLYSWKQCSYISDQVACEKFGRKDTKFQNWRWQPHQCNLPRFNATALLEKLRGKRLVYVGDSLNRGQWVSMVCLVESSIPDPSKKSLDWKGQGGSLIVFTAKEYNATIEFYWAPLLLESNSDHPFNHRLPDRIVRIQAIENHAKYWTDADILVFNTYLWWRRPKMKLLWGSFNGSDSIYKEVEMLRSYEMALKTWSNWLEFNVNHTKTQMFFTSMSPTHLWSNEWRNEEGNCYNETEPITREGHWGGGSDEKMMRLVEAAIEELGRRGVKVQMLNITQLSEYRKEAHPSIYKRHWETLTQERLSNPVSYADCIHWCLPGVPDTWNEILYALLFPNSSSSSSSYSSLLPLSRLYH